MAPLEDVTVDLVQNAIVLLELSGKGTVARDDFLVVSEAEIAGVLLGRCIPSDVVKIMVDCGVSVFIRVADKGLEVSLWRGNKVGVVEEESSWEIVPTHYAILSKRS